MLSSSFHVTFDSVQSLAEELIHADQNPGIKWCPLICKSSFVVFTKMSPSDFTNVMYFYLKFLMKLCVPALGIVYNRIHIWPSKMDMNWLRKFLVTFLIWFTFWYEIQNVNNI